MYLLMNSTSVDFKSHDTNSKLVIVVMFASRTGIILVEKKGEGGSIALVILKRLIPPS